MPVLCYELIGNELDITNDNGDHVRSLLVHGTPDDTIALTAVYENAPVSFFGLYRKGVRLKEVGPSIFTAEVFYGAIPPGEALGQDVQVPEPVTADSNLGPGFSFSTTGGTVKITQAVEDVARYTHDAADPAPDVKGAIGVTKDGVEGCEIVAPNPSFTITIKRKNVTFAYYNTLVKLTGTVNNSKFKEHLAGEVRYDGAEGTFTTGEGWSVTHNFSASPNQENIAIGSITVTSKRGWDYLWVTYRKVVDGGVLTMIPRHVYVQQVYWYTNFHQLEVGI